jgi:hypothetical protein
MHAIVPRSEAVMLRVSPTVKAEVVRLKGQYEAATGEVLSMNDALETLLNERRAQRPRREY